MFFWLVAILVCLARLVPGELVLAAAGDSKKTVQVATADYFASSYKYNLQDLNVVVIDKIEPPCAPVLPSPVPSDAKDVLVVVDTGQAFVDPCFCHDYRHLADQVSAAWTAASKAPLGALAFANSNSSLKGHTGSPRTHYMSDGFSLPDGPPSFVTVFVAKADAPRLLAFVKEAKDSKVQSLTQDPGPWNRAYHSFVYRSVWGGVVALTVAALVYAVLRLVSLARCKQFKWTRRTVLAYFTSMVTGVLLLCMLAFPPQSNRFYLFNVLTSSLTMFVFIWCLIIWLQYLQKYGIKTVAWQFLWFLYAGVACYVFDTLVYIVPMSIAKKPHTFDLAFAISKNLLLLFLFGFAVMFGVAAFQFYMHWAGLSPAFKRFLGRLALINLIAAFMFVLDGWALLMRTTHTLDADNTWTVMAYYLAHYIRRLVRIMAVLVLLPIHPVTELHASAPEETQEKKPEVDEEARVESIFDQAGDQLPDFQVDEANDSRYDSMDEILMDSADESNVKQQQHHH